MDEHQVNKPTERFPIVTSQIVSRVPITALQCEVENNLVRVTSMADDKLVPKKTQSQ